MAHAAFTPSLFGALLLIVPDVACSGSSNIRELVPLVSARPALTDSGRLVGVANQSADTVLFTDDQYGYSIRYPATWKRVTTGSASNGAERLFLSTPNHSQFIVSVYRLPTRVERYSAAAFDRIGHDHVDTVVSSYKTVLKLKKILREQPEDHSNDRAMIFWQGTSALDENLRDWALVSSHVIRYGSDVMINMVFIGGGKDVVKDGRDMDQVMGSIAFEKH